nr:hypothetical protein [Tanacetum cinerariifolium]GFC11365.1 hypothetical protein [Tanacetum cinerariifolium]
MTDVKATLKSEDPHVSSRTLNWVMYCIASRTTFRSVWSVLMTDSGSQGVAFPALVEIAKVHLMFSSIALD